MKVFLIVLILASFLFAQENHAPVVENVTFSQRDDGSFMVDIYYDVNDADDDAMDITIQASVDDGETWDFSIENIGGNVGENIMSGIGNHIEWDFGAEHPRTYGELFKIRIIADDNYSWGTVTDFDGNVYSTVQIGNKIWMAENLRVTHFRNGDPIPNVIDDAEWYSLGSSGTAGYCVYDNNEGNVALYGLLYNWFAIIDNRNIAIEGWHVPTEEEWETLMDVLGGRGYAGGKMKTTGTIEYGNGLWQSPNTSATNESGFSAHPSGMRTYSGPFQYKGKHAYWWEAPKPNTQSYYNFVIYNGGNVQHQHYANNIGLSLRLVKD